MNPLPPPSSPVDQEDQCLALVESAPVKLWIADKAGVTRLCNAAWRNFSGLGLLELTQWLETVHPDDRAALVKTRTKGLAEGREFAAEMRLRRADGAWRAHRMRVSPVLVRGALVAWIGAAVDIDDIRQTEAQYRCLANSLPVLIFEADAAGRTTFVNQYYLAYTGTVPHALLNYGWLNVIHPDDRLRAETLWSRAVHSGAPYEAEYRFRRHDGAWRWFVIRSVPVRAGEKDAVTWYGACVDVDDQRRAADRMVERETLFRTMAESIPQLAWMLSPEGSPLWFNRRWYEYTGASSEEALGRGWQKILHPDHLERALAGFERALLRGEPWEDTYPMRARDGGYRWFLTRAEPMRDDAGRITLWFGTNTDVTERIEAEQMQELLGQEISHRVKNSLALVSSLLSLQARDLEGGARMAVTEAAQRVNTVARLHDLLWRSSKAQSIDIAVMVSDLCRALASTAPHHKLECEVEAVDLPPDLAIPIALVINELVTNAFKYAYPEGGGGPVRVSLTRRDDDGFDLVISDHGVGLPEGFSLAGSARSLGMRVITALAQQLDARLTAEPAEPGTRFRLSLPPRGSAEAEASRTPPPPA